MSGKQDPLSRRQFIKLVGASAAGLLLGGCQPQPTASNPTSTPTATLLVPTSTLNPSASPTATPTPSLSPSATPPPPTATPVPHNAVATARALAYDAPALRSAMEHMLDSLGGFADLVKSQSRVGIKANLTGGTWWDTPDKPPATELFVTHPAVVSALCELLIDAGAGRLVVMDGLGDETSFDAWGYTDMAARLGLELLDLCKPYPYKTWGRFPVGEQSSVYNEFFLNQSLSEIDLLISVAKLKCHSSAGVTLALKNLVGLAPISEYRRDPSHNNRSSFHGSSSFDERLPRVVVDLNLACPVHFALIDGVITAEGGAGPWDARLSQVKPGLLLAGRDPVAVDAVGTAVMGLDPQAPSGTPPFGNCENHLALCSQAGLGTHALAEIPVLGPQVEEIHFPFRLP